MKPYTVFFTCITFLLSSTNSLSGKTIIWDLGYVLFKPDKMKAACYIGMWDAFCYVLNEGNSDKLKDKAFAILTDMHGEQTGAEHEIVRAQDKTPLPRVMCNWQAGTQPSDDILLHAFAQVEKADRACFFTSDCEKRLVKNTLKIIFDPCIIADIMRPVNKGIKLVKECQKNGHTQMVLSNFDGRSIQQLYNTRHGQKVFSLFDPCKIIISGAFENHEYLKPYPTFFKYLLNEYKLDPAECIFIDDQEENINAARECGITALQLKNGNYKAVRKELKQLGVLKE